MKNSVYFIVIALLIAELSKILSKLDDLWRYNVNTKWCKITKDFFCIELKLSTFVTLIKKFHDMSTVTFPWQHKGLPALSIQMGKSEFSSFKKCYLLLLLIQWVWTNMDTTQHNHKSLLNSEATNK